ncbi:glucose-6-phosphate 1-dehydrogenase (plasmid) [Scytonema sp. HK-05]|uniref:hypothetical protein n=1 Tax=Scytonema sp. HK-05 TaxID=1137095 RepID=UPI000AE8ADA0|nr:hypothetical protein [Scytonema sp. HK-05]BAY50094.1 glucose-6-phosphate 1-dehydrogenase [Scytonema sp. HK-05]
MTFVKTNYLTNELDQPTNPCVIVIFGAAGDLTKRKLIPALYNLARSNYPCYIREDLTLKK